MLVPSVLSLLAVGMSPPYVKYIVDNRFVFPYGSNQTVLEAIEAFTNQPPRPLSHYVELARQHGSSAVCFQQFVAGMRHIDLLPEQPASFVTPNDMTQVRESFLKAFLNPHDILAMDKAYTLVIEYRMQGRQICNMQKLKALLHAVVDSTKWNIHVLTFERYTIKQQFALLARTNIFISVAGTGSHLSMFLPGQQSVAIVVTSKFVRNVNARICKHSLYTCLLVNATCCESAHQDCHRNSPISVDLTMLQRQLKTAVAVVTGLESEQQNV
jgi:hypothetical protein